MAGLNCEADSGLEIYCEADSAWYDGKLSWDGDRVRVSFEGFGVDEDEWFDREILYDHEKLITRVRRTSDQLQDSECGGRAGSVARLGQNVCGWLVLGESRRYYDAVLKYVTHRRHAFPNGDEECRCRFHLLWKAGPNKGLTTEVGCGDLCFLSPKQPEDHPIIKDLLANPTGADRLEASPKKVQPLKKRKTPPSTFKNRTTKTSDRSPRTDAKMLLTSSSPHRTKKKTTPRKDDQADCTTNKQAPSPQKMLQSDMPEEQLAGRRKNKRKLLQMDKELESDPQRMNIEPVVDIGRDMVGGGKLDSVTSDVAAEKNSNPEIEEAKGTNGHCKGRKNKTSAEAKSDSALSEANVPNASNSSLKGLEILKQKDHWQSRRIRSGNKPPPVNVNKNDKEVSRGRKAPGKGSIDLNGETARKDQKQVQTSPQSRMLLIENMEADVSSLDALEILGQQTKGICSVHVMPKREFEPSTTGYAVYKDVSSAETALSHLQCGDLIIVASGKCRPWIVSIATGGQEPRMFGCALHSTTKSDVEGCSGIVSDQASSQGLRILTPEDSEAYERALRMTEVFEKYKKLRLELCKKIVEDDDNCL